MNQDVVIDKIKKLLRMKRGGTTAEVETALALARELASKHGLDINTINPDEETQRVTDQNAFIAARLQWECKYAMLVCERYFNVSALICRHSGPGYYSSMAIKFIGTHWDIQIAKYVFTFLKGHFRREWNTRRGRCRNRQAFMFGMFRGLCSKLAAQQQKGEVGQFGILRLDQAKTLLTSYITNFFGETEQQSGIPNGDAKKAQYQGFLAGRATEIRNGVGVSTPSRKLMQPTLQLT
jgi:hypothetical protein